MYMYGAYFHSNASHCWTRRNYKLITIRDTHSTSQTARHIHTSGAHNKTKHQVDIHTSYMKVSDTTLTPQEKGSAIKHSGMFSN
jgi:hypothetical protein